MNGYRFRGLNPRGVAVTGATSTIPEAFVKACFVRGWRTLELTDDDSTDVVGGIAPHPDSGFRVWWSS